MVDELDCLIAEFDNEDWTAPEKGPYIYYVKSPYYYGIICMSTRTKSDGTNFKFVRCW